MEWPEIKDPEGIFVFSPRAWEAIRGDWTPDEIQKLIIENGVIDMVREVNRHYSQTLQMHKPIVLGHIDGKKAVLAREE